MAKVTAGDNGRVRILDVVFSEAKTYRGDHKELSVKVVIATAYEWNTSSEVRRLRFDSYQDKAYEFTGKHPLKDDDIGDLQIGAYLASDYETSRLSTGGIRYENVYAVALSNAERMVKTLRYIDRAMDAKNKEDGYPSGFGQQVARFGTILGCTAARITLPESLVQEWMSDNLNYESNMGDTMYKIDSIAERWLKKNRTAVEEVA